MCPRLDFLGRDLFVEVVFNDLRRLPQTSVGEAVLAGLDPWDSVCLRTASVEWSVPGKYGPHGELFFFMIRKELVTMPGSETFFALSSLLTSARLFFFFADVLKKCALVGMHLIAEEGRVESVVELLI